MKINEILVEQQLDEGPIDFAKQVGAGIKGLGQGFAAAGQPKQPIKPGANDLETAINTVNAKPKTGILGKIGGAFQGAKAGYQQQGAANKQLDVIKNVSSNASKNWAEEAQNIQSSTGKPPTADDAVAWYTKFSGVSPSIAPAGTNPAQINQWLQKEVSGYMIKKGATAQQGSGTATATQQKSQQTPQAGQVPPVPQSGQGQPPPNQPAAPAAQQQPQAKPAEAPIPLPIPLDKLTAEERAELRRQLQASLKMAA